jgi:LPXTG-motif cell wall-anchored protein
MRRNVGFGILVMTVAAATSAHADCLVLGLVCSPPPSDPPTQVTAPEIDPGSAVAGLTLLAGGLAVFRGRRRKLT